MQPGPAPRRTRHWYVPTGGLAVPVLAITKGLPPDELVRASFIDEDRPDVQVQAKALIPIPTCSSVCKQYLTIAPGTKLGFRGVHAFVLCRCCKAAGQASS